MDRLLPQEIVLIGRWVEHEGRVRSDAVSERIGQLTNGILAEIKDHPKSGGWTRLYQDRADGRFWERSYPASGQHGGGPPALHWLSDEEAEREYNLLP